MKGSPQAILVIGLAVFLTAMGATGRLAAIYAALAAPKLPETPHEWGTGMEPGTGPEPLPNTCPAGSLLIQYSAGPQSGQTACVKQSALKGGITSAGQCQPPLYPAYDAAKPTDPYFYCAPLAPSATLRNIRLGGESFEHIIASPVGGYRRSLAPSTSWSPAL